ncbi:MAG: 50S ribosomal protein L25/general stress protein Ctc [Pseudomonadota bacterium]
MSDKLDLVAEVREDQGKGASRRLRRQGKVPAILYGGNRPPRALALDHNKLQRQMQEESFYSSVLTIKAGERTQPAIVKDIQRHPAKQQILHIDLQRVLEDERIRMNVPLHFINEETAVGIKQNGGVASKLMTEVEVTCLPADLPEYFEIDVADVDVDQMLHLTDIKTSGSVEIAQLAQGDDHDQPIFAVNMPKRAVETDEDAADTGEADGDAAAEPAADE